MIRNKVVFVRKCHTAANFLLVKTLDRSRHVQDFKLSKVHFVLEINAIL